MASGAGEQAPPTGPRGLGSIGPYELLEVLGDGVMGTVYRARQREPVDRVVAVKVLRQSQPHDPVLARFELEMRVLARMDHTNIAKVLDQEYDVLHDEIRILSRDIRLEMDALIATEWKRSAGTSILVNIFALIAVGLAAGLAIRRFRR